MRLLGIDLETTGLDFTNDHILEIAFVLMEVGVHRPLVSETHYIHEPFYKDDLIKPEMYQGHRITNQMLVEFGVPFDKVIKRIDKICKEHGVKFIVAHNGENFDRPMLMKKIADFQVIAPALVQVPWLDTSTDVEFPPEIATRKLSYLAAEHGFLNPFPHMALSDVMTMFSVLNKQDVVRAIERSQIPWATIRAMVDYDQRQLAKDRRFNWEICGNKVFRKCWVKRVKECDIDKEIKEANFEIKRIE